MTSNRRTEPRAGAINLVRIHRHRPPGKIDAAPQDMLGRTLDVSPSGMCIELDRWLPPNSDVECELALGNQILEVKGTIRHAQRRDAWRCGLGIEFRDLDAITHDALLEHTALRGAYH